MAHFLPPDQLSNNCSQHKQVDVSGLAARVREGADIRNVMVLLQSGGAVEELRRREGGMQAGREGVRVEEEREAVLMRVLVRCLPTERETIGE